MLRYYTIMVFCMGGINEKTALYLPYYSKCAVWKIQYSGWQSRGVNNLIKGRITIDRVNSISVNNSNVFLNIIRYFSSLLAALFYSMHLITGALKEAGRYGFAIRSTSMWCFNCFAWDGTG